MADTSGQADIRGIDIDKLAKGFAEEEIILKRFCTVTPTSAREIRWYQKTSGFLSATSTTAGTNAPIANVAELALPNIVEQSWTRNTSYVRKYFVASPIISDEDIKDSDPDILAGNIRDLTRAIANQVETRIWNVLTESQSAVNINTVTTTSIGGDQWDAASGLDPIKDLMEAKRLIRVQGYNPEGAILLLSPKDHMSLLVYLITTKGSSIPSFASQRVEDGVVMELLGLKVVVSTVVTADYAAVFVPQRAVTWKTFTPITARNIEHVGIGQEIRVWEEGEAILTDPKAVSLIIDTQT